MTDTRDIRTFPYRTPEVRDLAWACFSGPLLESSLISPAGDITDCRPILHEGRRTWLDNLDRAPSGLLDFLAARQSRRLGLYFEALWQFFLSEDPQFEMLACNLPVRDENRTVGEFDCLYFCRERERVAHLEFAVKFYLAQPGAGQKARDWLGPSGPDRLDLKLDRLFSHQLQLSSHPAGKAILDELGIDAPVKELALRGYLFRRPGDADSLPTGWPAGRSPHPWLTIDALQAWLADRPSRRYRILDRLRWLAPAHDDDGHAFSAENLLAELTGQLDKSTRPVLVAETESGTEVERFFVTPEDWPAASNHR